MAAYDIDALFARLGARRGPMPGFGASHGQPFRGVVEETPVLWVTWIIYTARRLGRKMPIGVKVNGQIIDIVNRRLTFGLRYYFCCPECGRRCEALYFQRMRCACRRCLHLGYQSQFQRTSSAWWQLDRILERGAARTRWSQDQPVKNDVRELRAMLKKGLEDMLSGAEAIGGGGT